MSGRICNVGRIYKGHTCSVSRMSGRICNKGNTCRKLNCAVFGER